MDQINQNFKVVNLLPSKDIDVGDFTTAYVNMENYGHVDFIISVGANGNGTKAVTLKEAQDKSGTSAATLTSATNYYYTNAAAAASASLDNDTYVRTTLTNGTFDIIASTDNLCYLVPIDATELNNSSSMTHVGVGIIATTSAACLAGCVAILSEPRYSRTTAPTALD